MWGEGGEGARALAPYGPCRPQLSASEPCIALSASRLLILVAWPKTSRRCAYAACMRLPPSATATEPTCSQSSSSEARTYTLVESASPLSTSAFSRR